VLEQRVISTRRPDRIPRWGRRVGRAWRRWLRAWMVCGLAVAGAFGQGNVGNGTFFNLDFEAANVSPTATNQLGGRVPASNALPGWSAYINGAVQPTVVCNDVGTGGPVISLFGPNYPSTLILQGQYTVCLQSGNFSAPVGVGQTGMIPVGANSIMFLSDVGGINVTFNGQSIPVGLLSPGVYGGSTASFAGQTGNLLFTLSNGGNSLFDDVTFSTKNVPEPGTFALMELGGLLIAFAHRRKRPPFH
jgi:hypothetical protein